jgi:hypothetical protein
MKLSSSLAITLCLVFLLPVSAGAQDTDLASAPGEVQIKMNVEYASAKVDGQEWDSEFMNNGKTIAIKGLSRSEEHTILLTASDDDLGPIELTIPTNAYKKSRKKRVVYFIAKRKVTFKPKPPEKEEAKAVPVEAAPVEAAPVEAAPAKPVPAEVK